MMVRVGSARLFRYQDVGISNAKCSRFVSCLTLSPPPPQTKVDSHIHDLQANLERSELNDFDGHAECSLKEV